MKKLLFMLLAALSLIACDKGGDDTTKVLELTDGTSTSMTAYADETPKSGSLKFTAKGSWAASVTAAAKASGLDWLALSQYSGGAGNFALTVTLAKNETGLNRKAEIKIVSGGAAITISVEQKATNKPTDPEVLTSFITKEGKIRGSEIYGDYIPKRLGYTIAAFGGFSYYSYVSESYVQYADKNFDLTLITPPADVMVVPTDFQVQPTDAKLAWAYLYEPENSDNPYAMSVGLTNVAWANSIDKEYIFRTGNSIIHFIYASKNVVLNGSLVEGISGTVGNLNYATISFANCALKEGWNSVSLTAKNDADNKGSVEMQAERVDAIVTGFNWVSREREIEYFGLAQVKSIGFNSTSMDTVLYGTDARVRAVGDTKYYGTGSIYAFTEKADRIKEVLVNYPSAPKPWRYEYSIDNNEDYIVSIKMFQGDTETAFTKLTYTSGLPTSVHGQQRAVIQTLETTVTYETIKYLKSNFDVAYYLITDHYNVVDVIDACDARAGLAIDYLPLTITHKGSNTDKYDGVFTYRYVRDEYGFVSEVYERKGQEQERLRLKFTY